MKDKRHAKALEWFSHSSGRSLHVKSNEMLCSVLKYLSYMKLADKHDVFEKIG